MSILINRCSRRAHLAEELVEAALLADHRDAMRACDAEELVMESLELSKLFIHATGNVINHLYDEKIENIDGCYRGVTKAFELAISVIKNINTFAREVVENDYPIERYDELKAMIPRLERARVDFENKWQYCPAICRTVSTVYGSSLSNSANLAAKTPGIAAFSRKASGSEFAKFHSDFARS